MKKILLSSLIMSLSLLASGQQKTAEGFVINGTINGKYEGKVYLLEVDGVNKIRHDSAEVVNGKYTFKGARVEYPKMMFIESNDAQQAPFFLENGTIHIQTNDPKKFWWSKQSHTINNELFKKIRLDEQYSVMDSLITETIIHNMKYGKGTREEAEKEFRRRSDLATRRSKDIRLNIVRRFPDEVISLFLLKSSLGYKMPADSLAKEMAAIDPKFSSHPYMISLKRLLDSKRVGVGNMAPEFSILDRNDKMIRLVDFRGKYVLIDFWASWCGPCKREIPNFQKIYKKHGGENFEIIGFSIDHDKKSWEKALQKYDMPWVHVCDLQAWGGDTPVRYNVQAVPKTILVDPEGRIVAIDLRGDELIQKIDALLKK